MNNLAWSVLTNIIYLGWTWAQSKAFILAYYILPDASSQADAAAQMEANKTGGANIMAQAAIAPLSRVASWYILNSPFVYSLPVTSGSLVAPSDTAIGDVPTYTEAGVVFAAPGGGGTSLVLGAVGSTPNADGATYDSGTGDFNLEPADATHPGSASAIAQVFGGSKAFAAGVSAGGTPTNPITAGVSMGQDGTFSAPAIWIGSGTMDLAHSAFYQAGGGAGLSINAFTGALFFQLAAVTKAQLSATTFDFTGLGNGGSIKLKSPDGTIYTLSVANGGTWNIV